MGFGRREAAREVEKVEVGARTLKRRLLADDERTAPAPRPAASSGRRVALTRAIGGAAFVYLAHRAWPRVRQDTRRCFEQRCASLSRLRICGASSCETHPQVRRCAAT